MPTDSRAADNFRNRFELPVLFYLALTVAAVSGLVTTTTLVLAWLFVLLRVAHSAIQCSYNKVMHRFQAYFAGGVVRWLLWAWLAWLLFLRGAAGSPSPRPSRAACDGAASGGGQHSPNS